MTRKSDYVFAGLLVLLVVLLIWVFIGGYPVSVIYSDHGQELIQP